MVHYILQPPRKSFHSNARFGRSLVTHHFHGFAWRRVTSINKCGVLTARAHADCHINTWLFSPLISCDAIIFVETGSRLFADRR